jgi:hypothetical protein
MFGGNQLGRDVFRHVEAWAPEEVYDHERKFQSDLQEYLDDALNSGRGGGGLGLGGGGGGGHVVSTERGTAYGDVVVDDRVGIELKRAFSNSQKKKLRGQLEDYADNYEFVIACACGVQDMDGWRELENIFTGRQQPMMDATEFAFVVVPESEMGGGRRANQDDGGFLGGDGFL